MYNFDKLDKRLNKYVQDNFVSGLGVAVIKDNKVVFDKNYGYANIELKSLVNNDTVFRLASMTKPITGVAVLICKDLGLLSINDYIDKYIPFLNEFYIRDIDGNIIDKKPYRLTIEQLLRHTSGLQSGPLGQNETIKYGTDDYVDLETSMKKYAKFSLSYVPGEMPSYSSTVTFDILARIVEIVSKMKYEDFLRKYIFDPLGMTRTTYSFDGFKDEDLAVLYYFKDGKLIAPNKKESGFEYFPFGYNGGGAGLLSTKSDYMKFANMLTNGGVYNGRRIISEESFIEMTSLSKVDKIKSFGLSVHVKQGLPFEFLPASFYGWSGAYGTHFFCSQKYGLTVVYMHNSHSFGGAGSEHCNLLEQDICEIFGLEK